jgi:hypothetical protein
MRRVVALKRAGLAVAQAALLAVAAAPAAVAATAPAAPAAQAPAAAPAAPQPPRTPKAGAPIDLTGNWVAIVNEDWRWRMVTPPKGDYASVPLSPAGRAAADTWTPAMDGSCKAYGVGGLMRMPTRLRINWDGEDAVRIETDAGVQTRRLVFTRTPPAAPRTLQGTSLAEWQRPALVQAPVAGGIVVGNAYQPAGGTLKVVTTNHTGGWLRKNGVPYSENAVITEYYDRWPAPDGAEWMSVTTIVDDPVNLNTPFMTSSHFRREADGSKWRPKPCAPVVD